MFSSSFGTALVGAVLATNVLANGLVPEVVSRGTSKQLCSHDIGSSHQKEVLIDIGVGADLDVFGLLDLGVGLDVGISLGAAAGIKVECRDCRTWGTAIATNTVAELQTNLLGELVTFLEHPGESIIEAATLEVLIDLEDVGGHIELDIFAAEAATYTFNVFEAGLIADIEILETVFIGLNIFLDLVLSVDAAIDLTLGFEFAFPEGASITVDILAGLIKDQDFGGLTMNELPIIVLFGEAEVQAALRLRVEAGATVSVFSEEIDFELAVFVDLISYVNVITSTSSCPLSIVKNVDLNAGVFAGVVAKIDYETFAVAPTAIVKLLDGGVLGSVCTTRPTSTSALAVSTGAATSTGYSTIVSQATTTLGSYSNGTLPTTVASGSPSSTPYTTQVTTVATCATNAVHCPSSLSGSTVVTMSQCETGSSATITGTVVQTSAVTGTITLTSVASTSTSTIGMTGGSGSTAAGSLPSATSGAGVPVSAAPSTSLSGVTVPESSSVSGVIAPATSAISSISGPSASSSVSGVIAPASSGQSDVASSSAVPALPGTASMVQSLSPSAYTSTVSSAYTMSSAWTSYYTVTGGASPSVVSSAWTSYYTVTGHASPSPVAPIGSAQTVSSAWTSYYTITAGSSPSVVSSAWTSYYTVTGQASPSAISPMATTQTVSGDSSPSAVAPMGSAQTVSSAWTSYYTVTAGSSPSIVSSAWTSYYTVTGQASASTVSPVESVQTISSAWTSSYEIAGQTSVGSAPSPVVSSVEVSGEATTSAAAQIQSSSSVGVSIPAASSGPMGSSIVSFSSASSEVSGATGTPSVSGVAGESPSVIYSTWVSTIVGGSTLTSYVTVPTHALSTATVVPVQSMAVPGVQPVSSASTLIQATSELSGVSASAPPAIGSSAPLSSVISPAAPSVSSVSGSGAMPSGSIPSEVSASSGDACGPAVTVTGSQITVTAPASILTVYGSATYSMPAVVAAQSVGSAASSPINSTYSLSGVTASAPPAIGSSAPMNGSSGASMAIPATGSALPTNIVIASSSAAIPASSGPASSIVPFLIPGTGLPSSFPAGSGVPLSAGRPMPTGGRYPIGAGNATNYSPTATGTVVSIPSQSPIVKPSTSSKGSETSPILVATSLPDETGVLSSSVPTGIVYATAGVGRASVSMMSVVVGLMAAVMVL